MKRFERSDGVVRLISENPAYAPMEFTAGVEIIGKVVSVLRKVR